MARCCSSWTEGIPTAYQVAALASRTIEESDRQRHADEGHHQGHDERDKGPGEHAAEPGVIVHVCILSVISSSFLVIDRHLYRLAAVGGTVGNRYFSSHARTSR